jgi:molybdenum cofactor cytidylyltransferase
MIVDTETRTQPLVAAVILAAGASRRMGQPKQLLPVGGQPMVRRVTEAVCAAGLKQVVVVLGARAEAIAEALQDLPIQLVTNHIWQAGLSTSISAGLSALRPEIDAVLLILADQPNLEPELLGTLVDHYRATGAPIVAPFYAGRRGNPVLFDRALFDELEQVHGDRGGRVIIARHGAHLARVDVDDPSVISDIDTLADYEANITA